MIRKNSQQLRIIGGQWRSRKITFPAQKSIRPTPDRVRETLFNWLAPVIEGAYCLDLFAGSGALGFEALSRGARHVVMVDKSPVIIEHLRSTAQLLHAQSITLHEAKIPDHLILPPMPFDIVFLDPPFYQHFVPKVCAWLEKSSLIKVGTYIYIETEKNLTLTFPNQWALLREGKTQQINYRLLKLDNPKAS